MGSACIMAMCVWGVCVCVCVCVCSWDGQYECNCLNDEFKWCVVKPCWCAVHVILKFGTLFY